VTTTLFAEDPDDPDAQPRGPLERMPPQDMGAEMAVLGGMLLSADAIGEVIDILQPRDYYRPAHETIHLAIVDLYGRGEPADPITVAAELLKRGEITKVGGAGYLHTLVNTVPTAANAGWYAEIVNERAVFRRLIEAGTHIAQEGYAAEGSAVDAADRAQAAIFSVVDQRGEEELLPMRDTIDDTIDHIEMLSKRDGSLSGLPTGFADLDALTGGLRGGQMIVIAGRPGHGKSTLAMDLARAAAIKHGHTCLFLSLEMGRHEINMRILSAEASVPLHHLRTGAMTDDDWNALRAHRQEVHDAPLVIDVTPNLTSIDVRTKARRVKQKQGLDLVVVDYLQLMGSGGRRAENRQLEVSEISRNLKLLAGELDVPVVALSQLNRGPEQRSDKKPALSDLRESGAIENDADMVILIHREDAYEREHARAGEADLIVAKHRGGALTTITVASQLHKSKFVDMAAS
jgi:replicative DNA helicase